MLVSSLSMVHHPLNEIRYNIYSFVFVNITLRFFPFSLFLDIRNVTLYSLAQISNEKFIVYCTFSKTIVIDSSRRNYAKKKLITISIHANRKRNILRNNLLISIHYIPPSAAAAQCYFRMPRAPFNQRFSPRAAQQLASTRQNKRIITFIS